ncbi:MAG: response regulator transcription factor [Bacteroidia bacterium]
MNNSQIKILVVEDEPDRDDFVKYDLENEGYNVLTGRTGIEALIVAEEEKPNLVIFCTKTMEAAGIEICQTMRSIPGLKNSMIIFLTEDSEEEHQIAGLEAGADDYISKPVGQRVMMRRIKALLKNINGSVNYPAIKIGDLEINREQFLVYRNGESIIFPRKEFELIELLASKPGKVFSRKEIHNHLWKNNYIEDQRTIDVLVRKVRIKLGDNYIYTVRGVGYKLKV